MRFKFGADIRVLRVFGDATAASTLLARRWFARKQTRSRRDALVTDVFGGAVVEAFLCMGFPATAFRALRCSATSASFAFSWGFLNLTTALTFLASCKFARLEDAATVFGDAQGAFEHISKGDFAEGYDVLAFEAFKERV
jgi:hypothetical protein